MRIDFPSTEPAMATILEAPSKKPSTLSTENLLNTNPSVSVTENPSNMVDSISSISLTVTPIQDPAIVPSALKTEYPLGSSLDTVVKIDLLDSPSAIPTDSPIQVVVSALSQDPTGTPSSLTSREPTVPPSTSPVSTLPTSHPNSIPTIHSTASPSVSQSHMPSEAVAMPSEEPSVSPEFDPSELPISRAPVSKRPTAKKTSRPKSKKPTSRPVASVTAPPSSARTASPSNSPSLPPLNISSLGIKFESLIALTKLPSGLTTLNSTDRISFAQAVDAVLKIPSQSSIYLSDSLYVANAKENLIADPPILISHTLTSVSLSSFPSARNNASKLFIMVRTDLAAAVMDGRLLVEFTKLSKLGKDINFDGKMTAINPEIFLSPSLSPTSASLTFSSASSSVASSKNATNTVIIAVSVVAILVGLVVFGIISVMARKYLRSRSSLKAQDPLEMKKEQMMIKRKSSMFGNFFDLYDIKEKITSTDSVHYELDQTRVVLDNDRPDK
eukprot:CAMPEP_0170100504 /NCGR_PEP_ID=MMETSP0020_2-20130122/1689_1 /TAXON_ID=98059 /ORGANISM="Dinobryon sp., Strain UTEXLB2267" /LENGTH=499 /DNA_ID=CAMNT_0010323395 /DNA_START=220 /DNA_END=1719 /DNA_ORIENTATION=+